MPLRQKEDCEYRQTTYHNGNRVQIEEHRRRSWPVRRVEAPPPVEAYTDFVLFPMKSVRSYPQSNSEQVSQSHPALRGRAAEPSSAHVTSAKHASKIRSRPVVLQGSATSTQKLRAESKAPSKSSAGLIPPPTPRPGRLPTPDLSDLDEAAFCDCGEKSHAVKYCTGCGMEIDPWSA
jgi:hypothetical protein